MINETMKATILNSLRVSTLVAIAALVAFLVLMVLVIPNGETMWADRAWATTQIKQAETPEEMKMLLNSSVSSTSSAQQIWRFCLYGFLFVNVGTVVFLARHWFLIRRLKAAVAEENAQ